MTPVIEKRSARTQALELIIEMIHAGKLPAGTRVNESALARELGVSQTPIRESLLSLQGQGYLTSEADRGFFVKPLTIREVEDIYPVLAALETQALKSIRVFPKSTLAELREINKSFAKSRGKEACALDDVWHDKLLQDCPNAYLLASIDRVRRDIARYENLFFLEGGNLDTSSDEHEAIIAALEAGNNDAACALVEANCLNTIAYIRTWLESRT